MKKLTTLLAVSGMVLGLASAAQAQVTTTPQDSYRGPYRLGFYTSPSYQSFTNDITWYDGKVIDEAAGVSELVAVTGLTWKCLGSTTNVDGRDNTETNPENPAHADVPIYNLNGVRIADGNAGLWELPWTIQAPFTDVMGVAPTGLGDDGIRIKTGTLRDGTKGVLDGDGAPQGGFYFGSTAADFDGWFDGVNMSWMDIDWVWGPHNWINHLGGGQGGGNRLLAMSSVIGGGPVGTRVEIK